MLSLDDLGFVIRATHEAANLARSYYGAINSPTRSAGAPLATEAINLLCQAAKLLQVARDGAAKPTQPAWAPAKAPEAPPEAPMPSAGGKRKGGAR